MDEIVVSHLIQVLLGRLNSLDFKNVNDMLVKDLEYVASMIDLAEVNETSYAIKLSLKSLQDLLFDFDDLIDIWEIEYGGQRFLRKFLYLPRLMSLIPEFRIACKNLSEIKKDLALVSSINNESKPAAKVPNLYGSRQQAVGREKDLAELLYLVTNDNFSVVSIVGLIGIGKTTLAQRIFDDKNISKCFEVLLWVGFGRNGDDVSIWNFRETQLHSLATFKRDFRYMLAGNKVFAVFDGCWDKALCESFLGAMTDIALRGSVVVVTTHSRSLASALRSRPRAHVYQLEGLSPDASFQILTERLFGSVNLHDPLFEENVIKIVELCRGNPLVLGIVRELLESNGPMRAQGVLSRLEECSFDEVTKPFTVYYDELPSYLKLPFQTLFLQKACGLSVEALTCIWMALGFLYQPHQYLGIQAQTQLLDVGRQYLREFAESDLPCNVEYAPGGVIRDIHMDEHMCYLSISKARGQWVLIHNLSSQKLDKTGRYIIWLEDSLPRAADLRELLNARKARLFMLRTRGQASGELLMVIIKGFKCLRVLGLGGCDIEDLPSSIGYLKHLRYLDLGRNARLKRLPRTISKLWHLQTLLLNGCEKLIEIPASIGRLKNLMYLTLTTLQKSLPEQIGKLTSLRTLGLVKCQRLSSLPRSIKNLKSLETLAIVDCPELDLEADASVEAFKGSDGIDTLLLRGLPKFVGLPSDLGVFSVAMKHLVIQSCTLLKETMWINQLKSLRSLTIEGCPELTSLVGDTTQFDSLLELVIRSCPMLGNTAWIKQFMSLRSLIIHSCPNLVYLDAGFAELIYLQRLEISECPYLAERCAASGEDWKHIEHVRMIEIDGKSLKS